MSYLKVSLFFPFTGLSLGWDSKPFYTEISAGTPLKFNILSRLLSLGTFLWENLVGLDLIEVTNLYGSVETENVSYRAPLPDHPQNPSGNGHCHPRTQVWNSFKKYQI